MKRLLIILLCILCAKSYAQQRNTEGLVFDATTKDRIAVVYITNLRTGESMYNSLNGTFKVASTAGDWLVFSKMDYFNDTVRVTGTEAIVVYLKRTGITLKQVDIRDTMSSPKSIMAKNRWQYSKAYGSLANRDLISIGGTGVGLSIDALYNMFSSEGRNAKRLRDILDRDYKQNTIDYRFNKTFVSRITGLTGKQLSDFMIKYRPGYYFITSASEYEFISSIRTNLKRYLRNPTTFSLPSLGEGE
ncbi:hypothetical protein [Mucilaginibacter auburnensis]|uniref:Carboxypeptidase-like protein n=1 Tax=Mucilaginibacter auburnensis TaxID=1457233 RepID=A0A2H9VRA1_9SPHI|nr:hypothetical protein [Mucilaginibacter auburnensis]PJJ83350.1 hypothetical protein CLV57_0330 [Mucilaginibacter auburnensis]